MVEKNKRTTPAGIIISILWHIRDLSPSSIDSISKHTGICWESVKRYLEVLETIGVVDYVPFGKRVYYALDRGIYLKLQQKGDNYMTHSNGLKSVVSRKLRESWTIAPRKPLNLNCSPTEKSLMCGSLNGQPIGVSNHDKLVIAYDEKRISALQSNKIQLGREDCSGAIWKPLQIQHKLPYYLDSEVSEESACGESA